VTIIFFTYKREKEGGWGGGGGIGFTLISVYSMLHSLVSFGINENIVIKWCLKMHIDA
jgi:hypothetical protein